jgi:mycothiol synthase
MENSTVQPAPPHLAGLTWRAISRDDLAALCELAAECHLADGGLAFLNEPDNLKDRYFPGEPLASIGAFADAGRLVACTTLHLARKPGQERAMVVGQVRPEWRGRGIGTYLMRWSQVQAQALFTTATVDQRLLQVSTESLSESAIHLYLAHGFKSVFEELVLQRGLTLPLPDCPLPPGVTIASWQPALASAFFQAYEAAFRARPGFPGYRASEWISRNMDDNHFRPEWSLLASKGGEPVGFLTASAEQQGGYVVQVGVIPGQRRRGLGSALIVEAMRRMQAAGETATQLVVNINNPAAIQAYAGLGFATVGRRARYERTASQ